MTDKDSMLEAGVPNLGKPPVTATPGGHPIEIWISHVLRIGVSVAGAIILTGVLVFLIRGPVAGEPDSYDAVTGGGGHSIAVSWDDIWQGVTAGHGLAIVQLGLLVLVLTPLMRVGMTVILFIAQRDRPFIVVTTIVFIILVLGFLGLDG